MESQTISTREFLRHILATLAYRGGKVIRDAPEHFGVFRLGVTGKTPTAILAHIGDLLAWTLSMARGSGSWHESKPSTWEEESRRFFDGLSQLDEFLASEAPLCAPAEKLFQGPIADALTHVGQLAMLRRLANAPIRSENYYKADIVIGRVGADQSPPPRPFE